MTMRYIGGGSKKIIRIVDSREIKTVCLQWLKQLNTIRIVRLVSLCCFMQMEKKDILLLPMDCKLVRL